MESVEKKEEIRLSDLPDRMKGIPMTAESVSAEFTSIDNANEAVLDTLIKKYEEWERTLWRMLDVVRSMETQARISKERKEILK